MIFSPKLTTLVANVQSTLQWSGADFQASLGYAQPEKPISMTFSVQNLTAQVCYVAISFQTRNVTYAINNRKSIVGVPSNSTLRIASNLAPELASLGPDLVSVTLYLISAAAGNVSVSAEAFDGTNTFGVGGSQNIGQDERSVLDYIPIRVFVQGLGAGIAGGGSSSTSYTVPSGKRADIILFSAYIESTPFGIDDSEVLVTNTNGNGFRYTLRSQQFEPAFVNLSGFIAPMDTGDQIVLTLQNNNPNAAVVKQMSALLNIKEYFN